MKSLSWIIQGVLVIAVVVLYFLHFRSGDAATSTAAPVAIQPGGIYFVNSDSLLDNYEYYKSKKADLQKRQERIRGELKAAGDKLERDVRSYQENAGSMSGEQRQQIEESLMMRQQQLIQQKEELLSQLDEEQARYSDSLFLRLSAFLRTYNKDKGIHYVLGYQRGGGILYASDSLDITGTVLDGLNSEWKKEQE